MDEYAPNEKLKVDRAELNSELLKATRLGDERRINELLCNGADIEARVSKDLPSDPEATPLYLAVYYDYSTIVQLLLNRKACVNVHGPDGLTPLHAVVLKGTGDIATAQLLLDYGADINALDASNQTSLMLAVEQNDDVMVDFLLKKGASLDVCDNNHETALYRAVDRGSILCVEHILTESSKTINMPNLKNTTPLDNVASIIAHMQSNKQHYDEITTDKALWYILLRLLEHNAAISPKSKQVLKKLLSSQLFNKIHRASIMGDLGCIQDLLSRLILPESINSQDCYLRTALHWAVIRNQGRIGHMLLAYRAETDAQDFEGNTALHFAARNGYDKATQALLESRANMYIRNLKGRTALWLAHNRKQQSSEVLLEDRMVHGLQHRFSLSNNYFKLDESVTRIIARYIALGGT